MKRSDLNNILFFANSCCPGDVSDMSHRTAHVPDSSQKIFSNLTRCMKKYGVSKYEFIDFCNVDLQDLNCLCHLIIKKRLSLEWSAPALINPRMDEASITSMKKAGCKKLVLNLLSGSDEFLKRIGSNFTTKDVSRLMKACRANGILVGFNLMVGHPQETERDFESTLHFLKDHLSFFDEITKVNYCLCHYLVSRLVEPPSCKHWTDCLGTRSQGSTESPAKNITYYMSKILKLGKPVVCLEPGNAAHENLRELEDSVLRTEGLVFRFDSGKGQLFWRDLKLTCGLGLYTSLFAMGLWHDSEHAEWKIKKIKENKFFLEGKWHLLPVIQRWEVELVDVTIKTKIEMEVLESITIEGEQQLNIMLKNDYLQWSADSGLSGFFPQGFNEEWVTFFDEKTDAVTSVETEAANRNFPIVSLGCKGDGQGSRLAALNTSSLFRGRILKCYRVSNRQYRAGRYPYFEGELRIFSK